MSRSYRISAHVFQCFDHMLVAIEDISGQIGHNYMRDKYVNTSLIIQIVKLPDCV